MNIFLGVLLYLALSPFGNVKLGDPDEEPKYGYFAWFAMLFSAGTGTGLLFWSIAEPITHYVNPPTGAGETVAAAENALKLAYFHWGIHGWAIFALTGLSIAYFAFRRKLPLAVRSAFYPLIGDRIYGPIGHLIDILAVLGTMFGVATSLGLGVMQLNAGLNYLIGIEQAPLNQVLLIAGITAMATISVVLGLDRGIKRL
ncbi:MAG: BCCT family transporter, partial [Alphaproteobacteria bacterium]|nr:BCCT family transporter [Alphaproteobacteria bacterium]